jgi:hypothetical protein
LFGKCELYIAAVTALSTKQKGLTRNELVQAIGYPDGSKITEVLNNLELSGFIRTYNAYPNKKNGSLYQLIDHFSLFSFSFLQGGKPTDRRFWSDIRNTPRLNAWRGYAFEIVCLNHMEQIKQGLGISGILTWVSSWRSRDAVNGAQIDLVIDRGDRAVNLCEIKYAQSEYVINKEYAEKLRHKVSAFMEETKTRRTPFLTMITTYGIKQNSHSGIVRSEIAMDALFEPIRL